MNEKVRPTKKQRELLEFIDKFIKEHGYSPSYREIMSGCSYNSVATVALHVNSLIKRGHLIKRGRSARSLELCESSSQTGSGGGLGAGEVKAGEEKWLVDKVDRLFQQVESNPSSKQESIDQLYVLVGALKVLGLDGAAQSFIPRLSNLKTKK